jgi:prepilin-type N-terminal cleavage/methylation domain-containing protein
MLRRCKAEKPGFTVVELLAAMMAGSILALTVGIVLVHGFAAWRANCQTVDLQREGSLAMKALGRAIRESPSTAVSVAADQVTIGTRRFRRLPSGDFIWDPDTAAAGDEVTVVQGRMTVLTNVLAPSGLSARMVLQDRSGRVVLEDAWAFRN